MLQKPGDRISSSGLVLVETVRLLLGTSASSQAGRRAGISSSAAVARAAELKIERDLAADAARKAAKRAKVAAETRTLDKRVVCAPHEMALREAWTTAAPGRLSPAEQCKLWALRQVLRMQEEDFVKF